MRNLDDLRTAVDDIAPGDAVVVRLQRGTRLQFLTFEME